METNIEYSPELILREWGFKMYNPKKYKADKSTGFVMYKVLGKNKFEFTWLGENWNLFSIRMYSPLQSWSIIRWFNIESDDELRFVFERCDYITELIPGMVLY